MNGHLVLKNLLLGFWNTFGGRKNGGEGFDPAYKLAELQRLSRLVITYKKQQSLEHRREVFDIVKTEIHPWKRFGRCFVCEGWATARHHIIQLQNGGINSRKNLVSLCDGCHAKIHHWL